MVQIHTMRYFTTKNATLPLKIGAWKVSFEPYGFHGGACLGFLATDNESIANALAKYGHGVSEIQQAEYDVILKKKVPREGPQTFMLRNQTAPASFTPPGVAAVGVEVSGRQFGRTETIIDNPVRIGKVRTQ